MIRRVTGLALTLCAAWATVVGSGCAAPQAKVSEFQEMAPAARLLALEAAGPYTEGAAAALGDLLKDRARIVRAQAAQVLGTWAATGDARLALPALAHNDPLVRGLAQTAYLEHSPYGLAPLVTSGNVIEVPPAILSALADMEERDGRVDLARLLLDLVPELRRAMEAEPETAVLAADLLARVGDAGARRHLIRLVETGEGPVLTKAVRASVRDDMGLGPTLLPLAFKGDAEARRAVMQATVARPDPRLASLMVKGLRDDDAAVRHNAIRAMGNLGAAAPLEELVATLRGPETERADTIRALGAIGRPAADALRNYLQQTKDKDILQVAALLALAPNANRDDIAWVSRRLASPNLYVRAAAVTVLGRIGHPAAQAALVAAMKDPEPLVRAAVAKALGQVGTVYAAQQLVPALKDPSPLVASMAAWGLGAAACADAVPALKEAAKARTSTQAAPSRVGDMFGWPELAALEALGRIHTPAAVAALREHLKSRSWLARAVAAQGLGAAGDASPEVLADLEALLADKVNVVRAQALLSLKALGKTFEPDAFRKK